MNTSIRFRNYCAAAIVFTCMLQACSNSADYKSTRKEVIDMHDKIMMEEGRAMINKMKLDTLMKVGFKHIAHQQPGIDTVQEKQHISALIGQLEQAGDEMNDWMHAFNPDVEDKTEDQAVEYFKAEKIKLQKLDSLYNKAISESEACLGNYGIKPEAAAHGEHNHH